MLFVSLPKPDHLSAFWRSSTHINPCRNDLDFTSPSSPTCNQKVLPILLPQCAPNSILAYPLSAGNLLTHNNLSSLLKVLVTQSCPSLCDPMNCSPPGSSVHGILQARRIPVGFCSGLPFPSCHPRKIQRIFLTQESNLGLLHCRQILYHPRYQGSPFSFY